ncbi:MAG TPA: hypothetical protein VJ692_07600, partial [Nitrospiraceae bacterium]|nr:hypothetical protein [Nitrospiraceae bacterium]
GAIRLVAPQLTNQGTVQALNGPLFCPTGGGPGRIRLECTTCAGGTTTPAASVTTTLGPITAASTPPLINVPTLTMSTVGGLAVPPTPAGMYTTADVSLPAGSSNPVPITLTATNTPVGTVFTVKVIPQSGTEQLFVTPPSTGSLTSSTATALVNLPPNQIALLYAFASFPVTASVVPARRRRAR